MPEDELLEHTSGQQATSFTADEFGGLFVKNLELEYASMASQLSAGSSAAEFRQVMARAIFTTFVESGLMAEEVAQLMAVTSANLFATSPTSTWTSDDNARRIKLIDQWLQKTISPAESLELAHLTARMRAHCDREEMLPMDGAERLHRQLLERNSEAGSSDLRLP